MLLNFSIRNFRSLKEIDLSLETGLRLRKYRDSNTFTDIDPATLKSVALFGANGSGKSNIIKALRAMQQIIIHPLHQATEPLTPYTPYLFNVKTSARPTTFTIDIVTQNQRYHYTFSYNKQHIVAEALSLQVGSKDTTYFSRDENGFSVLPSQLTPAAATTRSNVLFLNSAQAANDQHAINVLKWFSDDLIFFDFGSEPSEDLLALLDDPDAKRELMEFLHFADINIQDIDAREARINLPRNLRTMLLNSFTRRDLADEEDQIDPNDLLKELETRKSLYTLHKLYDNDGAVTGTQALLLSAESVGTQKVITIALTMIAAQREHNKKVIIFDEFDDSLHYELSSALLRVFNSPENQNQFILTTHELKLLDEGLRKDQIYFVDKDFQGETKLYSLFDIANAPVTKEKSSLYNLYRSGTFGAIPDVDVTNLRQALQLFNTKHEGDVSDGPKI